jgi:hypothetical protein
MVLPLLKWHRPQQHVAEADMRQVEGQPVEEHGAALQWLLLQLITKTRPVVVVPVLILVVKQSQIRENLNFQLLVNEGID